MLNEFKAFIARGNVVDLAVGIIIGAAFTAIVTSLVNDIIMPPIGLLLGGIDFSNFFLTLKAPNGELLTATYPTLKAAQEAGAVTLNYGLFINAIVKFVIVAFAVFVLVKQVNKLQAAVLKAKAATPTEPTAQEKLLMEIRDLLKK